MGKEDNGEKTMRANPYSVVRDFEEELAAYAGSRFAGNGS